MKIHKNKRSPSSADGGDLFCAKNERKKSRIHPKNEIKGGKKSRWGREDGEKCPQIGQKRVKTPKMLDKIFGKTGENDGENGEKRCKTAQNESAEKIPRVYYIYNILQILQNCTK